MRSITEIRRAFTYNAQNAIIVRGTADQVALAEKLIAGPGQAEVRSGDRRDRDGGEPDAHPGPGGHPHHGRLAGIRSPDYLHAARIRSQQQQRRRRPGQEPRRRSQQPPAPA